MININKCPQNISDAQKTQIITEVFKGREASELNGLNIDLEEKDDKLLLTVKRSKNPNWNRKWTPVLNYLFPDTYSNGWLKYISLEVTPELNEDFSGLVSTAIASLGTAPEEDTPEEVSDTEESKNTVSEIEATKEEVSETEVSADTQEDTETKPEETSDPVIATAETEIEEGRKAGLSEEQIMFYARPKIYTVDQMAQLRLGFCHGVDVSQYADPNRSWISMMSTRLFLERNLK